MCKENEEFLKYHNYLLKRSLFGDFYRKYILFPKLKSKLGNNFIDVGCGLGEILFYGDIEKCIGLDINPYNIKFAANKGLNVKCINPSEKFPLEDNSTSSVLCDQVLEHVKSPDHLLSEIHRILRFGGQVLFGVPCEKGFMRDEDHIIFYDLNKLKLLCKKYNFLYKKSFYFPIPSKRIGKLLGYQSLYATFESI